MAIHLGRLSPGASRDRPGQQRGNASAGRSRRAAPIWSCSGWGLPCRFRCRKRGGLLHRRFALATHPRPHRPRAVRRYAFCCTVPGVAPAGGYPAPCSRGARTFLARPEGRTRPSGRLARV